MILPSGRGAESSRFTFAKNVDNVPIILLHMTIMHHQRKSKLTTHVVDLGFFFYIHFNFQSQQEIVLKSSVKTNRNFIHFLGRGERNKFILSVRGGKFSAVEAIIPCHSPCRLCLKPKNTVGLHSYTLLGNFGPTSAHTSHTFPKMSGL